MIASLGPRQLKTLAAAKLEELKKVIAEEFREEVLDERFSRVNEGRKENLLAKAVSDAATRAHPGDRDDLRKVADLVRDGKRDEAYQLAGSLDTIVRESIPDEVWDWFEGM